MLKGLRFEEIGQLLESFGLKAPQTEGGFEDILLSLMKEIELQPGAEEGSGAEELDVNKESQKKVQQLIAFLGAAQAESEILPVADPSKGDLPEKEDRGSVKIQEGTDESVQRQIAQPKILQEVDIGLSEKVSEAGPSEDTERQSPVVSRSAELLFESPPPKGSEIDKFKAGVQKNKGIPVQPLKTDTTELFENRDSVLPPDVQKAASKVELPEDVSADSAKMNNGDPLKEMKREEITSSLNMGAEGKVEDKKEAVRPGNTGPEKKSYGLESEVAVKVQKSPVKGIWNASESYVNATNISQDKFPKNVKTSVKEIPKTLREYIPIPQNKPIYGPIKTARDHKPDTRIDKTPLTTDNTRVNEPKPEEVPDTSQRVKEAFPKYADKEVPLPTNPRDLETGKSQKETLKTEFASQVRDREAWLQSPESGEEVQTLRAERREIPLQPHRQDVRQINIRIEDAFLRFRFQSEALSVDIRIKEMLERNLSYLDVQRLSKSLQSLGLSLEGLKINGTELYPRGSKFGKREERRFNIEEDAVSDKKAPDSSADSPGLNLLL